MIEDFVSERCEQNRQVDKINLLMVIRPSDQTENILKYDEDWDSSHDDKKELPQKKNKTSSRHKKAKSMAAY